MGTDHLALVATSCIAAALAASCATPAYQKVSRPAITGLHLAFVNDRPGLAHEERPLVQQSPSDLMILVLTVSNPLAVVERVRVTCVRADGGALDLDGTYALSPRSDRRIRLGGIMAEPFAYDLRCGLTRPPAGERRGGVPSSAPARAEDAPAWVRVRVPANDGLAAPPY